jgi:hypothetical protein
VFLFLLIAAVVLPATRRLISTRSGWAYLLPIASGIAFVLVTMLMREWFYGVEWVRVFLDGTVRLIPIPIC